MSEKKLKNFAANQSNQDYITCIQVGSNEREVNVPNGDKEPLKRSAENLGLEITSPDLSGVTIKTEIYNYRVDRENGTIERFDKNGKPIEIERNGQKITKAPIDEDAINRIDEAYARRKEKGEKDTTVVAIDPNAAINMYKSMKEIAENTVTAKSKRGRKPKQEQEGR